MMNTETREKNGAIPLPATSGPRPYRCDICQRSFREVATLRKHEQLHRADRPYICTTCGKSFLWSSNLKVHERVHTGERPYKCKICHRCFTQSNDLRRHERNVHMRGKLYSYKTPAGRPVPPTAAPNPGHMNLAAYQAFAMQQRALLQHALTYEGLMQNSVAMTTASHYLQHSTRSLSSLPAINDSDSSTVSTSAVTAHSNHDNKPDDLHVPRSDESSFKLEQVTPPPGDHSQFENNNNNTDDSPGQSRYSPASNKAQSPSRMSTTSPYTRMNGHNGNQSDSPLGKKEDQSYTHESRSSDYTKYFNYPDIHDSRNRLHRSYHSAFNLANDHGDVIDLRINKSLSSVESEDGELDWKARNSSTMSSKSPDSESESDSKRDVTTTSYTPTVDSGIHHCQHCNIFFHDFTMFNLHQSLHSPVDENPFMCPSCLKRCQDRIEFMFHIVWHVKYPHTIPKYQSFKENYMLPDPEGNEIETNDD